MRAAMRRSVAGGVDVSASPVIRSVGGLNPASMASVAICAAVGRRPLMLKIDPELGALRIGRPVRRTQFTEPPGPLVPSLGPDARGRLGDDSVAHSERVARHYDAAHAIGMRETEIGADASACRAAHQVKGPEPEVVRQLEKIMGGYAGILQVDR